jgi:uncharacterized GH25 family protein
MPHWHAQNDMKQALFLIFALSLLAPATFAAEYTGKVLTPDGKPVKNATVYLFKFSNDQSLPTTRRDAPTTQTDDSGAYHISNPDANGAYLAATAPNSGFSFVGAETSPADIHLTNPTSVTLTFLTPDKSPAAHLNIYVFSIRGVHANQNQNDYFYFPLNYRSIWTAATDDQGRATFTGLPQGATIDIGVLDHQYAQLDYHNDVSLSAVRNQPDPIRLTAGASISGKVTDAASGQPVAGIAVNAASNDGGGGQVLTAADGTYTIKQLSAGTYSLQLMLTDSQQTKSTAKSNDNISITQGTDKSGVDFSLIPGVVLRGTVVAADDGNAVPNVPISIFNAAHPRRLGAALTVYSDSGGAFAVRVPTGEQFVYVSSDTPADGFGRPSPDNKTLTIADGATAAVEFRLPRVLMAPIKGKVVDPDGNPVVGASVYITSDLMPMFNRVAVITNATGVFQSMPMQRVGKIDVRAKFHDFGTPKPVTVPRTGELVVHLEKDVMGTITGRVVDSDGKPLQNAKIELIIRAQRYSYGQDAGATDADGKFKIDSLWPDLTYFVQATRDGYGQSESPQLHLQAGQPNQVKDLSLFKRDTSIAGVLLDADEKPVTGKRIYVTGSKSGYSNLNTDADGKFTCQVVSNDRLTVFYNLDSNVPYRRQTVRAGDQNIVLHTSPPKPAATPPAHVNVAAAVPAQPIGPSATDSQSAAPAPTIVYDPAAAVTWNGWLYAAILLAACTLITGIASAIATLIKRKPA